MSKTLTGLLVAMSLIAGCISHPQLVPFDSRRPIDRKVVEYPAGFTLKTIARGLTGPSAIAFVKQEGEYYRSLLVAESGADGRNPRIYGWKPDGTFFNVYPRGQRLPLVELIAKGDEVFGPIGGMVTAHGRIFITHRDANGRGVVSSVGFDGSISTVVADLPSQGDHGLTDIAVDPISGKLFFAQGAATNSGVVGTDNWDWVKLHPEFCDLPAANIKLLGYKFDTSNPNAGLFGGDDNVSTAPFHPFGRSSELRIAKAPNDKPTAAVYTISPTGGDLRVWAHGIRLPRGLAFDQYGGLFATNNGMELRGTRPVKDDPDALLKIIPSTWYGWPDFSTDLQKISDEKFQEPDLIRHSGYPELSFLIDHATSGLTSPESFRATLLYGSFPALSGAAKLDFVPPTGPFRELEGSAIVTMSGDRSPLASGGQKLRVLPGRKIVRVELVDKHAEDFIRNTQGIPASAMGGDVDALERPIDAKFGPDGNLYILDMGRMEIREDRERITTGTGKIFILEPIDRPATTTPSP